MGTSDAWRDQLRSSFAGLEALDRGDGISGSVRSARVGDVGVYEVSGSTQLLSRSSRAVRQEPYELLKVCVQLQGQANVQQQGRSVTILPGELAVYDISQPYRLHLLGPWRCAVMTVRRDALRLPDRVVTGVMDRVHPAVQGAGALLSGFVQRCVRDEAGWGPGSRHVGDAGVALLAGAVCDRAPDEDEVSGDAVRAMVLAYLQAHLADDELTPASVAAAHHMALRTLHRLFEGAELGVAGTIRDLRLDHVRRDLADPLLAGTSIAGIAARWGIRDQAWLSRSFRARFGSTPSAYRGENLAR